MSTGGDRSSGESGWWLCQTPSPSLGITTSKDSCLLRMSPSPTMHCPWSIKKTLSKKTVRRLQLNNNLNSNNTRSLAQVNYIPINSNIFWASSLQKFLLTLQEPCVKQFLHSLAPVPTSLLIFGLPFSLALASSKAIPSVLLSHYCWFLLLL